MKVQYSIDGPRIQLSGAQCNLPMLLIIMIIIKIWGERHFCLYTLFIQFNSKFGARQHPWHRVLIMRNKYEYNRILLWEISWASSGGCVISNTSLLSAVYGFIHNSFLWMWSSLWEQYVWHPQPSVWRAELNNEGGCYFVQKISYRPKWKIERKYLNFVPGLERWLVLITLKIAYLGNAYW